MTECLARRVGTASRAIPSYLPRRLTFTPGSATVEWIVDDGHPFTESFFEQTLRRVARGARDTGSAPQHTSVERLRDEADVAPSAFIFHVSRCGSTLLCQMLASLEDSVVISEAPILDDVLRGNPRDGSVQEVDRAAWFRGAVGALCRRRAADASRLFIKLDAWHLFALPVVRRAFPDVPFLFVYRNPLEVLVSLARTPSMALVRDTLSPAELGLSETERNALGQCELGAAVLAAYYRAATMHRAELIPLAYDALPEAGWRVTPAQRFSEREIAIMRAAACRDAKNPERPFLPDSEAKQRAVTAEQRLMHSRWTDAPYAAWLATIH